MGLKERRMKELVLQYEIRVNLNLLLPPQKDNELLTKPITSWVRIRHTPSDILGNLNKWVRTRIQLEDELDQNCYVTMFELKNVSETFEDDN